MKPTRWETCLPDCPVVSQSLYFISITMICLYTKYSVYTCLTFCLVIQRVSIRPSMVGTASFIGDIPLPNKGLDKGEYTYIRMWLASASYMSKTDRRVGSLQPEQVLLQTKARSLHLVVLNKNTISLV